MRAALLGCVAALLAAQATQAASFTGLGILPRAVDISADGSTVIGVSGHESFRWTQSEGLVPLGVPDAAGLSHDGSLIVGTRTGGDGLPEPYLWTQATGAVGLGFSAIASGMSADGSTVVGRYLRPDDLELEAFRWTADTGIELLGRLPDFSNSAAWAASGDGSVVIGDSGYAAIPEPFRWTEASGMIGLGSLYPGFGSSSSDVSLDGSTVVGAGDTPFSVLFIEAFRWTEQDGMLGLGVPDSSFVGSYARAVSADGAVIVGTGQHPGFDMYEALIWDEVTGMRVLSDVLEGFGLDLTGWTLRQAVGVSADGLTIVGNGTNPNGRPEAWIAVIPEPSTGLLLALGLVAFATGQRPCGGRRASAHRA